LKKKTKAKAKTGKPRASSINASPARSNHRFKSAGVTRNKQQAEAEIPREETSTSNILKNGLRLLALVVVVGITVSIYSIRDRVSEFAAYGYPGIFLVAMLANATVFLPAPGVAVVFAMGSIFNPVGVALAAGTGGALGELSGYLAGFSGQAVVERTDLYNRFLPFIEKYGAWAILVLSAIPNPLFDIAGVAAGVTKIPLWRFLLFCWIGQLIKMAMFAYAGMYSIDWVSNLIK
jgi:uncharacterized membrane protein YdjX (TVP38/TMEM64 family)